MNFTKFIEKNSKYILILILFIAAFFRFYNYPNRISMGLDSARDAFVSLEGAKKIQLPLTGPFISIAPVTTGPWYWIQLILAKLIMQTSYAPWLLLAIYSMLMVFVMYKIGVRLEGKLYALILALITAISPNQISNAVGLTNPAVIGFYASIVFLIFLEILGKGNSYKLGIILGLILGLTINTHYQSSGLITLPLLLLVYKKRYLNTLVSTAVGLILTFIPTIIFELNNHWFNTRHMIDYLLFGQYQIWVPIRWLTYVSNFWPNFMSYVLGGNKLFILSFMAIISAVILYKLLRRKLAKTYILILISFTIQVVIIRYYRGEKFFGYLQFFHPFIFCLAGLTLYQFFRISKIFGAIVIVIYLSIVIPSSVNALQPEQLTLDTHQLVNNVLSKFGEGPFKVFKCQRLVIPEVNAFILELEMRGVYNTNGKPLAYFWGCDYPGIKKDGSFISDDELKHPDIIYPSTGFIRDFSIASPSAIAQEGWVESSPEKAYQSAARWWFDEQP